MRACVASTHPRRGGGALIWRCNTHVGRLPVSTLCLPPRKYAEFAHYLPSVEIELFLLIFRKHRFLFAKWYVMVECVQPSKLWCTIGMAPCAPRSAHVHAGGKIASGTGKGPICYQHATDITRSPQRTPLKAQSRVVEDSHPTYLVSYQDSHGI